MSFVTLYTLILFSSWVFPNLILHLTSNLFSPVVVLRVLLLPLLLLRSFSEKQKWLQAAGQRTLLRSYCSQHCDTDRRVETPGCVAQIYITLSPWLLGLVLFLTTSGLRVSQMRRIHSRAQDNEFTSCSHTHFPPVVTERTYLSCPELSPELLLDT